MTLKNTILITILTIAATLSLTGCHSSKNATGEWSDTSNLTNLISQSSNDGTNTSNVAYVTTPGEWSTLSCPVKVALKSPTSMSASGRAQMVRGKCIFVSMRMLGFEVATLYVDNDSIVVADKFHKKYFSASFSDMRQKYNLSISALQDVLLGRKVNLPNFNGLTIEMTLPSDDSDIMSALTFIPANAENIYFTFGTPMTAGDITMTSTVNVNTKIKNKDAAVTLTWEPSKASFDTDINPTPTNTSGYTQISLSAITSTLKAQ
jgi:hypothetical protein